LTGELYWDSTYAIALALIEHYPEVDPEDVGLHEMAQLIEKLPEFSDDPALVTERILLDIQIVWYEEVTNL
jgi:FeS assembly protein IscX